ncbi:MAG TPA: malto-oligosyltrehalose synthase [Chloroflexia bacterium]|nr:malto-oligosyltrehalose synthase [Chloroflexia bacterium]
MSAPVTLQRSSDSNENIEKTEKIYGEVRKRALERTHFPIATYRVQLNRLFTFKQATDLLEYLNRLGISDLYASPYFRARSNSMHGYDICNHNELNPTIGTQEDYDEMVEQLHHRDMYQILDTVPNHMGIGETGNTWWMDVLENGPSSYYAPFFDIDWDPINPKLKNKVLLPVLGDQYGKVLENKELQLNFNSSEGTFTLHYYDVTFPVNPVSYSMILEINHDELVQDLGIESEAALEYQSILTAINHLPPRTVTEREKVLERNREKEVIKRRLAALCTAEPRVENFIRQNVDSLNGVAGDRASFNRLDALMEEQSYRLSFWRVAAEEINYRRFFDINELAAVRVDQDFVFEETHRLIFKLLGEGKLNGLRIDHVDGLRNPAAYFENLQRGYFRELCRQMLEELQIEGEEKARLETELLELYRQECTAEPQGALAHALYIVVEKILGRSESLPLDWQVYGTTGYEFTNAVNGIFVDNSAVKAFDEIYASFIQEKVKFADLVYEKKKQIMRVSLSSEITALTNLLFHVTERDRHYRDFTISSLRNAIREVIACFPVYRTYTTRAHQEVDKRDQVHIEMAIVRAKKRNTTIDPTIFDFIRDILLLWLDPDISEEDRTIAYNFLMKFQQTTGPVIAKGLEDTAFYVYNRLISLNEVGGEPEHFGNTVSNFHRQQAERNRNWPYSLLTTSTHDTKRSEDVRARIDVLSEVPREWRAALNRWVRFNRKLKKNVEGNLAPDRNEEYFLYQTLLGVWPFAENAQAIGDEEYQTLIQRLQEYMRKAMNEAKINTSWVNPNEAWQQAVADFIVGILERNPNNRFLPDFVQFQKKIAHYGVFNSLGQVLIKITSPGIPDIYQGNEIWDLSMVDPDNRRPVDYDLRQKLLGELDRIDTAAGAVELVSRKEDGRIKLFVTSRALRFRRDSRELFQKGSYTALEAQGPRAENICAFARSYRHQMTIIVVPRLMAKLAKSSDSEGGPVTGNLWEGTFLSLPGADTGQKFRNVFTGEVLEVQTQGITTGIPLPEVLASFPVALLEKIQD